MKRKYSKHWFLTGAFFCWSDAGLAGAHAQAKKDLDLSNESAITGEDQVALFALYSVGYLDKPSRTPLVGCA